MDFGLIFTQKPCFILIMKEGMHPSLDHNQPQPIKTNIGTRLDNEISLKP